MLTSGTILIEKDALRPQCFQVEDDSYPNAWMSVKHHLTSRELEEELSTAGWTFFYMANAIRATAFGSDRAKTIPAALKRLMTNARRQGCNCFETSALAKTDPPLLAKTDPGMLI